MFLITNRLFYFKVLYFLEWRLEYKYSTVFSTLLHDNWSFKFRNLYLVNIFLGLSVFINNVFFLFDEPTKVFYKIWMIDYYFLRVDILLILVIYFCIF